MMLTAGALLATIYFYMSHNMALAIYFATITAASAIFYPKYFKWRFKKHYKTFVRENYSKRFGQEVKIEIGDDVVAMEEKAGEAKLNVSELEHVDETENHFFVKIASGGALIVPKRDLDNMNELRQKWKDIGLLVNEASYRGWL